MDTPFESKRPANGIVVRFPNASTWRRGAPISRQCPQRQASRRKKRASRTNFPLARCRLGRGIPVRTLLFVTKLPCARLPVVTKNCERAEKADVLFHRRDIAGMLTLLRQAVSRLRGERPRGIHASVAARGFRSILESGNALLSVLQLA